MIQRSAPTRAGTVATAAVATVLAIAGPSPATMIDPFCALQARHTIDIGNGSSIDGDVAATEPGGRVQLGRKATMSDDTLVLGDEVRLGPGASASDVEANDVFLSRGGEVRGSQTSPALPVLEPSCDIPPLECGGESVSIKKGQSQTPLPPGSYDAITVRPGATLTLQAGAYRFCELNVGRGAAVALPSAGQVDLGVAGDVRFGVGSALSGGTGGSPPRLEVAGAMVRFSSRAVVIARLSAPNARLMVGPRAHLTGRFCADRIHVSRRGELACPDIGGTTTTTTVTTTSSSSSSTVTTVPTTSSTTSTTMVTTTTTGPSTTVPTTSSTSSSTSTVQTSTSSSTSSSSTPSSTAPGTSSSSTSLPSTSTSTSSSTTTSSSSSTSTSSSLPPTTTTTSTSTTTLPTCGDGVVQAPESCDDGQSVVPALQGNPNDNDACPGDCAIETCSLVAGTTFTATVAFSAASPIGGGTLLVVYPEGKVGFPVTGPVPPTYFFPLLPPQEVLVRGTNLGHALRVAIADGDPTEPVPVGPVAELRFQTCMSKPPPLPGEFQCYVIEMSDPVGNPVVTGVSCSVQVN